MGVVPNLELVERGATFVDRLSETASNLDIPMHAISKTRVSKNFDGSPRQDILEVTAHIGAHASGRFLDEPLFIYDNETSTVTLADNPTVNAKDCTPDMLVSLANGILDERYPVVEEIRDSMLSKIGGTLLAKATPRVLMAATSDSIDFIYKDEAQPDVYMATPQLFFGSIATQKMLAFDVHDIAQHATQIAQWSDVAHQITTVAYDAFTNTSFDTEEALFRQRVSSFAWNTGFEESVLNRDGELFSFGCLNWLTPGDTPVDFISSIDKLTPDEQRIAHRWHYLDAIKDLYRKQYKSSRRLGIEFDWMEQLGYDGNSRFMELVRSSDPLPFLSLDFSDADKLEVIAPSTPQALFRNALQLLKNNELLKDSSTNSTI